MTAPDRLTIRVAHLLDGRHFGGAEQMVRRLALASPRVNIDASVYGLNEGRLTQFLREGGVRLRVFPSRGRFDLGMIPAIADALKADGADLIQAHTSRTHLLARIASRRTGIPNVTTIHSPIAQDENRSGAHHPGQAWVERWGRPWTQAIVPVSREEAERLVREERAPAAKVRWIPNGVEDTGAADEAERRAEMARWLENKGLNTGTFTCVMIAQMRPRKGPETLIDAFASFRRTGGEGVLLMIGDGEFTGGTDYLTGLQARARDAGLGDSVHFTGFMEAPWTLAQGADLFVLPSLFGEGLPLVLIEAMNHARAAAASDTLGNRELIREAGNGWLFPPGDAEALAKILNEAAADPAGRRERGEAGRRRFLERYELGAILETWRECYEDLLHP